MSEPELIKVADEINARIERLEELVAGKGRNGKKGDSLDEAGRKKAQAIADYDLAFAKAMALIARNKINQIEGVELPDNRPANCLLKYAAAMCHKESADLEIATNEYKSLITKIEVLSATLNAKQSIFRHLSHEVK